MERQYSGMEDLYRAPGPQPRERFQRDNVYADVQALDALPEDVQNDLLHTYDKRRKKLAWSYVLWAVIPGWHSFYLGRVKRGILFLASLLLPVIWFFWWVIDAIRMQDLVGEANSDLTNRLLRAGEAQAAQASQATES